MNRRRALLTAGASLLAPGAYAQPVPIGGPTGLQKFKPGPQWAGVPGLPPSLDLNLLTATLDASITWTRANNNATNGLFTDASGAGFSTFLANAPRISVANGLLIENARTNLLLNSSTPVTQTTGSLATGVYSLWVNGAGTATPSAVTATGSGFTAASQGVPSTFTITVAGTVLVTVGGALNRFQLEVATQTDATSYVPTVAATLTRAIESGTAPTAAWYNAASGTFVVDFMQLQITTASQFELPTLYTDASNLLEIKIVGSAMQLLSWSSNVNNASITATGAISAGIVQRVGFTYDAATKIVSLSLNGGPVGFAVPASLATFNQIKFGVTRGAGCQDGFTRRLRYYPRALQVPELRAVTVL
jgi:hypothetical protein